MKINKTNLRINIQIVKFHRQFSIQFLIQPPTRIMFTWEELHTILNFPFLKKVQNKVGTPNMLDLKRMSP